MNTESSTSSGRAGAARLIAFAVVVVGLLAALKFLPLGDYVARLLAYIESLGPLGPILLAVVYIVATVAMVPGTLLTLAAGFTFGLAVGTLAVVVGSVLGAWAAFVVGRTIARDLVEQKTREYPRFGAIQRAVERSGFKIVTLTRLSPLFPFNVLNYLFSVTTVRTRDYVLGSLIGMFPGTLMYVYFGTAIQSVAQLARGEFEGGAAQKVLFAVGLLATIGVTVYITREARRALREHAELSDAASHDESPSRVDANEASA